MKAPSIESKIDRMLESLEKIKSRSIIVSNEVGLGIVPKNKLARDFRDVAGRINQVVADKSGRVFFMVSGIPWRIK
jgi:adenosylcobinamide kinase/adenosylcobinamide-phosphate guanylyltransferase